MTAVEKAKDIIRIYNLAINYTNSDKDAKECAIEEVDNILRRFKYLNFAYDYLYKKEYWIEVKKQLIKFKADEI